MNNDLLISDSSCLQSIVIMKESLMNLNSLSIYNNPHISTFITEEGGWNTGSFNNVKNITISSFLL